MFLNQLLSDKSKKAFLDLALICAKSDEVLDEKEKEIFQTYCDEMGTKMPTKMIKADYLVMLFSEDISKFDEEIKEILDNFSSDKELAIAYFELCAMIYVDDVATKLENYILETINRNIYFSNKKNIFMDILKNSGIGLSSQMNVLKNIEKFIKI